MANTVTTLGPTLVHTEIPMTGSDVNFTFNSKLGRALVQASASTSSLYLAAASSGNAGLVLPNGGSAPALELRIPDLAGQQVTFKGTNLTTVQVIEYLTHT